MDLTTFLHVVFESGFGLFCILAAIYLQLYGFVRVKTKRVMTAALLISAVINFADTIAYFYRGNTEPAGYYMVRISNFVVFAGMLALIAAGSLLLDKVLEEAETEEDGKLSRAIYGICAAGIVMLAASRIFGFLYYFDEQNRYHREKSYILLPLVALAGIILLIVRTVKARDKLSRSKYIAFMAFWLLPVLGAVAQIFYYGISLANIANSISIILMLAVYLREAIRELAIKKNFILSGETIESISAELDSFLKKIGTEKQNRIRVKFTMEEALLNTWQHFGDPTMVKVTAGIRFGRPSVRIDHEGEAFNPFSKTGTTDSDWSSRMLSAAGLSPVYSYKLGNNTMKLSLGRLQVNPAITLLIAILFGLITGSIAMIALKPQDVAFVTNDLLIPVYDLWNRILYSVSAPAMLVIVMSTMLDTREVSEQGGNSGRIVGRYFIVSLIVGLVPIALVSQLNRDAFSSEPFTRDTAAELIQKFFSIVPENFLDPFRDFNTAQLIMMGIVLAYAVMAVGQQASSLAAFIRQLNLISTQLAQWIATIMPVFTIFLTAQLVLENNAGLLVGLATVIPFALITSLVVGAFILLYVCARMKVDAGLVLKKLLPSFWLTFRTGQVDESYALAESCCRKELGIQKILTQRLMPLGLVLYMPMSMIGMISFVIYAAGRSGMQITPVWMITAIVFALILLVAAPPIPGINLLSYVVIIGQLGLGKEYIIAAMIFDLIYNLFASAANQMMLQLDLILQADRVGLLNKKMLAEPKTEQ